MLTFGTVVKYTVVFPIVASLLTCGYAYPVSFVSDPNGPPFLTSNNYTQLISSEVWWVEYFHPNCVHCKAFAPTWNKIYQDAGQQAEKDYGFHMARVSCLENGDICSNAGIDMYPTIQLTKDGEVKDKYTSGNRDLDVLLAYMERHIHGEGEEAEATSTVAALQETGAAATVDATDAARTFPAFPDSTETVNSEYPAQPHNSQKENADLSKPNPYGRSENLDHVQFTRKVTSTKDPWIIKFYSPWCPHCKSMAAAWDEMAGEMKNRINIGEVNCEVESQFCRDASIAAFPTVKYFEGALQIDYEGLRGVGDLVDFADSALKSRNTFEIKTVSELDNIAKTSVEQATYLYFYDDATFTEDFEALQRLALNIISCGTIFKTKSPELIEKLQVKQFPSLYMVMDSKKWYQFPGHAPSDMRNHNKLVDWAKEMWMSVVPQLTPVNAKEIFNRAKYVVLAVVDPRNQKDKETALREVKATAVKYLDDTAKEDKEELLELRAKKILKVEEAKDKGDEKAVKAAEKIKVNIGSKPVVAFAWIDGVFWERWLKTRYGFDFDNRKPIIINDQSGRRYWDSKADGRKIPASRSQLLDVLEQVMVSPPEIKPQILLDGFKGYLHLMYYQAVTEWHISGAIILLFGWLIFGRRRGTVNSWNWRFLKREEPAVQLGKID